MTVLCFCSAITHLISRFQGFSCMLREDFVLPPKENHQDSFPILCGQLIFIWLSCVVATLSLENPWMWIIF